MQIRPFDGTLHDAQGLIEVDGETFRQCHYAPDDLVQLLSEPGQWAAVAVDRERVVGFVSAFETQSLAGRHWEVDELAVRPAYQGRGLGTRLVSLAVGHGVEAGLPQARAVVATSNGASQRAFEKNGFRSQRQVELLLYEIEGRVPRPLVEDAPSVRQVHPGDAALEAVHPVAQPGNVYLVAEGNDGPLGYAELVEVHTLQYRGFWLESIGIRAGTSQEDAPGTAPTWDPAARTAKALANCALEVAKSRADLELVGYLASPADEDRYLACISEGYRRMGAYHVLVRDLAA